MSRATSTLLDEIHGLQAKSMLDDLQRNAERAALPKMIPDPEDPTGKRRIINPDYEPLNTKLLAVVRAFLKDNGVDTAAAAPRINALADQLRKIDVGDDLYRN